MSYFAHHYASNSDLKKIVSRHEGHVEQDNLQLIFNFGTEFHAGILEPHKANWDNVTVEQRLLIEKMSKTFWKDEMCRSIAMAPDFRREHEFYRSNRFGVGARCKTDGDSKKMKVILELKGLSVTSEKQFKESILHLSYDQGATWYLNTASSPAHTYDYKLIAGISKKDPDLMFKLLIGRDHEFYKFGLTKVEKAVALWKQYGFN